MKWETPERSSRSSREPAPIQNPSATERTLGTFSEITRSPESSSERTYFCTSRILRGSEGDAAARPLGAVERLVGEPEERLRVGGVGRARSDAEARPHPREPRVAAGGERLGHARHDLLRVLVRGFREQERELVAADPEGVVGAPQRPGEDRGERAERVVSGRMPVAVVQRLEAVEIAHDETERPAVAL